GPARRDNPDTRPAVGHHHRPVLTIDLADHQPPWLICGQGRDLDPCALPCEPGSAGWFWTPARPGVQSQDAPSAITGGILAAARAGRSYADPIPAAAGGVLAAVQARHQSG